MGCLLLLRGREVCYFSCRRRPSASCRRSPLAIALLASATAPTRSWTLGATQCYPMMACKSWEGPPRRRAPDGDCPARRRNQLARHAAREREVFGKLDGERRGENVVRARALEQTPSGDIWVHESSAWVRAESQRLKIQNTCTFNLLQPSSVAGRRRLTLRE